MPSLRRQLMPTGRPVSAHDARGGDGEAGDRVGRHGVAAGALVERGVAEVLDDDPVEPALGVGARVGSNT
jgi:hypothetical protein